MRKGLPLLTVIVGVLVTSCGGGTKSIEVGAVTRADVTEVVTAAGTISPRSQAVLTSPADDAVVQSVLVSEGQKVRAGDILVRLSSRSTTARLALAQQQLAKHPEPASAAPPDLEAFAKQLDASAQASFASARAAADQINNPQQREQALAQIASAQRRYDASRKAADISIKQTEQGIANASDALTQLSSAQHDSAQAAVFAAQEAYAALTIRAPFAGSVTLGGPAQSGGGGVDLSGIAQAVGGSSPDLSGSGLSAVLGGGSGFTTTAQIEAGAHLGNGTPVVTVVDATTLSVVANVDETDVLSVHLGDPASVELDAVPGATYYGNVIEIDQLPATSAGGSVTYPVRMTLRTGSDGEGHPVPRPRAGMSAVANLTVLTSKSALSVPVAALVHDTDGHDTVWLDRNGHAHAVIVQLGAQGSDTVAITSGVSEGDRVVIKGADRVKEGQKLS